MRRRPTLRVARAMSRALHRTVGRWAIGRFVDGLVRPHVVAGVALDAEYRAIAADVELEREARE